MRQIYRSNQRDKIWSIKAQNRLVNVFLVIFFILFISSVSQTSKKIQRVNMEVTEREEELEAVRKEREELELTLKKVTSEEYIEEQLRNELNLVKENETILILPPDDVLQEFLPDQNEETVSIKPNWQKWLTLFGLHK